MPFMLGSFAGGLWQGASSAMSLASNYMNLSQQYDQYQARQDALKAWDAAKASGGVGGTQPAPGAPGSIGTPADGSTTTAPTSTAPAGGSDQGLDTRFNPPPEQRTQAPAPDQPADTGDKGKPAIGPTKTVKTAADGTVTTTTVVPPDVAARQRATGEVNPLASGPIMPLPAQLPPGQPGTQSGPAVQPPPPGPSEPLQPPPQPQQPQDFSSQTGLPMPQPNPPGPPQPPGPRPPVGALQGWVPPPTPLPAGSPYPADQPMPPRQPSALPPPPPSVTQPVGGYFPGGYGPQTPAIATGRPGGPVMPPPQTTQMPAFPAPPPGQAEALARAKATGQSVPFGTQGQFMNPDGTIGAPVPSTAPPVGGQPGRVPLAQAVQSDVGAILTGMQRGQGPAPAGTVAAAGPAAGQTPQAYATAMGSALAEAKESGKPVPIAGSTDTANPDGTVTEGAIGGKTSGVTAPEAATPKPAAVKPAEAQAPAPVPVKAEVAPGQTTPSVQSERPLPKPPRVNMDAWNSLSAEDQVMLTRIAGDPKYGAGYVTGPELANTWKREGNLQHSGVPDNPAGDSDPANYPHGPFQIKPRTQDGVDHTRSIDTSTAEGGAQVAALLFKHYARDNGFAPGSAMIHLAYMAGEGRAQEVQAGKMPMSAEARNGLTRMFDGADVDGEVKNGGSGRRVSDQGVVRAVMDGARQGYDGVLQAIVNTGPTGAGTSQLWATAQSAFERYAIVSGHPETLPAIAELFAQQSHAGTLSNLGAAYNALLAGDAKTAAMFAAKAHAYFPDGTTGRFGTDPSGQHLYGEQFLDANGERVGQRVELTAEDLAGQIIRIQHPTNFLQVLQEHQLKNAQIVEHMSHAQYYQEMPEMKAQVQEAQNQRAADRIQAENQRQADRLEAQAREADIKRKHEEDMAIAEGKVHEAQQGGQAANERQYATENDKYFGPKSEDYPAPVDPAKATPEEMRAHHQALQDNATDSANYPILRRAGQAPEEARFNVQNLRRGTLQMAPLKDGSGWALVDENNNPRGYLSNDQHNALQGIAGSQRVAPAGAGRPQAAIGAGMNSPMVAMSGANQNMANQQTIPLPQPGVAAA